MLLKDLINKIKNDFHIISDQSNNQINEVVLNSKLANNLNAFIAIKGFKTDGHKFIQNAYSNGCRDFVLEEKTYLSDEIKNNSTVVITKDNRKTLALLSNAINDYPFNKLKMIGITGTKGKSTVTTLTHKLLSIKYNTSMFSTIKNIIGDIPTDAIRTTMEANELMKLLDNSYNYGESHAVVEVSSHAITLKRIYNVSWNIGIFTSFSRDHLDLYGNMDIYFQAKLDFFRMLNSSKKSNKLAIINIDDPKGEDVCKVLDNSVRVIRVGKNINSDYRIEDIGINKTIKFTINHNGIKEVITSPMLGEFNIINIALAFACAVECGCDVEIIKKELSTFYGVEGRFEIVVSKPYTVIVDYAHTPDSLDRILLEAKKIASNARVISVFGCTGERDKDKRSIMGDVAAKGSDFCVITNDDTYDEDPLSIAEQVEKGFIDNGKTRDIDYKIILDRKEAIRYALDYAEKGDVIICAGMGHEKHQILADGPVEHNDKEYILKVFKDKGI